MGAFFQELLHVGIYKRSQGRITRQVTFAALAVTAAAGVWRLSQGLLGVDPGFYLGLDRDAFLAALHYAVPGVVLMLGIWASFRIVNIPAFADFLIAVEAEMNKVSWPTRNELFRASLVVLFVIFALAMVLTVFDFFWRIIFTHVLRIF